MSNTIQRETPNEVGGTIRALIDELTAALPSTTVADPRRVAADVIAALLEVPRSWPFMNVDGTVDRALIEAARGAARKLSAGAPFAYAVGRADFRHLNLAVDDRVLIPRPETEMLVGEILERMHRRCAAGRGWGTALDIGTGSGAIALSLASEGRFERVIATDVSLDALHVAGSNAVHCAAVLRTNVEFRHGSLLSPVGDVQATVLASNPPYIAFAESERLPASVRDWEPPLALLSGHDGMTATRAIVRDGARVLVSGGLLALEVDETRASLVAEIVMLHGAYTGVGVRLDLAGRERFVFATRI
ncbi:MAG TPA: HemK/PrmC family methyltransferase [Gemmatimonadaceae bacterium]|nr:HemK/PrmC family methyltransferase [Gemmatimonadaceae bacterium]